MAVNIKYEPVEQRCINCAAVLPIVSNVPILECEYCGTHYLSSGPRRLLVKKSLLFEYGAEIFQEFMTNGGMLAVEDMSDIQFIEPMLTAIPEGINLQDDEEG